MDGAKTFCRIRSYLASARKQNISASRVLSAILSGEDIFAQIWAE